jgi:hypothetical protein
MAFSEILYHVQRLNASKRYSLPTSRYSVARYFEKFSQLILETYSGDEALIRCRGHIIIPHAFALLCDVPHAVGLVMNCGLGH